LEEADERYQNRESREEDVMAIQRLRDEVKLNEEIMKTLNVSRMA